MGVESLARLQFRVQQIPFSALPMFGPSDPFARIAPPAGSPAEFPRWTGAHLNWESAWEKRDRKSAIEMVARRNPHLPAPPVEARFVVAGQQAGLLTGPLYTFLKAVSTIATARQIQSKTDAPVLPLFWVASEDHDILEVNRVTVAGRHFVQPYEGELKHGTMPQVADISLREAREPLLAFLKEALQPTEFSQWVLDVVAAADFSNYDSAFSDLLRAIFREWTLRVIDPVSLRPMTSPVLADMVERWDQVVAAFQEGSEVLHKAGFDPPLASPGFFEIVEGNRVLVEMDENRRTARSRSVVRSWTQLAEEIRARPAAFSPAAALRPILQDAALPVVVTFGGPTELLYLWQIDPIYRVLQITRSRLLPRVSATFVEARIQRAAEKSGLGPDQLFDARHLLQSAAYRDESPEEPRVHSIRQKAEALLHELDAFQKERPLPWLEKANERLAGQIEKIVGKLHEESSEEAKRSRSRLERIAEALTPGGVPQERRANPFEFLNLYGPDFVRLSVETLDPLAGGHQVVHISTESEEG